MGKDYGVPDYLLSKFYVVPIALTVTHPHPVSVSPWRKAQLEKLRS